jgi:hypothetical protein
MGNNQVLHFIGNTQRLAYQTVRFCPSIHSSWHLKRPVYEATSSIHSARKTITEQDRRDYVLKLEKNLYGQKQAGRVWYLHLRKNLLKLGFKPSQHDECIFYYGKTIFIVYTDDTILLGPDKDEIDLLVKRLGKTFKIEDQGNLSDYLGIKIKKKSDGTLEWT